MRSCSAQKRKMQRSSWSSCGALVTSTLRLPYSCASLGTCSASGTAKTVSTWRSSPPMKSSCGWCQLLVQTPAAMHRKAPSTIWCPRATSRALCLICRQLHQPAALQASQPRWAALHCTGRLTPGPCLSAMADWLVCYTLHVPWHACLLPEQAVLPRSHPRIWRADSYKLQLADSQPHHSPAQLSLHPNAGGVSRGRPWHSNHHLAG